MMGCPGLKVAIPSTPADAKGLMKSAIRDDNPVVYLHHYMLTLDKGDVPEGDYVIPFGVADIKRVGTDVTIVATAWMVKKSLAAAETLAKEGISAEVVDPRTLAPLDVNTILNSVKKTGRLVLVDQAPRHASAARDYRGGSSRARLSSLESTDQARDCARYSDTVQRAARKLRSAKRGENRSGREVRAHETSRSSVSGRQERFAFARPFENR